MKHLYYVSNFLGEIIADELDMHSATSLCAQLNEDFPAEQWEVKEQQ